MTKSKTKFNYDDYLKLRDIVKEKRLREWSERVNPKIEYLIEMNWDEAILRQLQKIWEPIISSALSSTHFHSAVENIIYNLSELENEEEHSDLEVRYNAKIRVAKDYRQSYESVHQLSEICPEKVTSKIKKILDDYWKNDDSFMTILPDIFSLAKKEAEHPEYYFKAQSKGRPWDLLINTTVYMLHEASKSHFTNRNIYGAELANLLTNRDIMTPNKIANKYYSITLSPKIIEPAIKELWNRYSKEFS